VFQEIFFLVQGEERRESGNHTEQRTGFKTRLTDDEKRIREKRERRRKNRPKRKVATNVDNRRTHTHAARARAKEEEEKFYA
jgi:hypothetical protein